MHKYILATRGLYTVCTKRLEQRCVDQVIEYKLLNLHIKHTRRKATVCMFLCSVLAPW